MQLGSHNLVICTDAIAGATKLSGSITKANSKRGSTNTKLLTPAEIIEVVSSGPVGFGWFLWPIGVGATLVGGVLLGAFWLRNDRAIQRMHGWVQRIQKN